MYEVSIRCEKSGFGSSCMYAGGWRTNDLSEPEPAEWGAAFAEHGWVVRDGLHYCPRHDPAKEGECVRIGLEYVELAPGVRARWPQAQQDGDSIAVEVQRDGLVELAMANEREKARIAFEVQDGGLPDFTAEDWGKLRRFAPGLVDAILDASPMERREYVVSASEPAELRTPEEWGERYGVDIMDPDGWRSADAPAWTEPITLADFYERARRCTVRNCATVDWLRIACDAKGS
ncbi:hypothetical protein Caci_2969 [Catenulispora acidiphila DSM 44928]|uniref:Uncharacterized protein n=1 Tax=Catenulispora acidiphila (strain DSM 44928 / JCM 14897 / NBRC 102108 / NRRL B-24433 / ID139908) TaxID=479433 RepID=C7Q2Y6_CATAD|nr:hypothetical protein [Catenulispora acidiphila]ACU71878.1 hypothetical protein Caci_2969 [Catenulispora acidiphila DSM 44928]